MMKVNSKNLPHSLASWKPCQPRANPKVVRLLAGREHSWAHGAKWEDSCFKNIVSNPNSSMQQQGDSAKSQTFHFHFLLWARGLPSPPPRNIVRIKLDHMHTVPEMGLNTQLPLTWGFFPWDPSTVGFCCFGVTPRIGTLLNLEEGDKKPSNKLVHSFQLCVLLLEASERYMTGC